MDMVKVAFPDLLCSLITGLVCSPLELLGSANSPAAQPLYLILSAGLFGRFCAFSTYGLGTFEAWSHGANKWIGVDKVSPGQQVLKAPPQLVH